MQDSKDSYKPALKDFSTYHYNPFRIDSNAIRPFPKDNIVDRVKEIVDGKELTFSVIDGKVQETADFQPYTRIYSDAYDLLPFLSSAGMRVLVYIFKELGRDKNKDSDMVMLKVADVMSGANMNNKVSVYNGIINLLQLNFIAKRIGGDSYYINPALFFKCSRRKWFQDVTSDDRKNTDRFRIYPNDITRMTKRMMDDNKSKENGRNEKIQGGDTHEGREEVSGD